MIINCINLAARHDRRKQSILEFEQQGAYYKFWDGVRGRSPRLNIHTSHKRIIQYAKDNGLEKVVVCEDDVRFGGGGAYQHYLDNMPHEFDIYFGTISSGNISPAKTITGIFTGMILYCVNACFYDKFLSAPENKQLDYSISSLGGLYKVCYPFAATCHAGYSDARGKIVDDSKHFKGRKLFPGPI